MAFDEEKQIQTLINLYGQGFEEILRIIIHKEAKGQWTRYWKDILKDVYDILSQLDSNTQQWIEQTIGQVYSQATAQTAAFLMQLGQYQKSNKDFAQIHQRAIDVVAQNMSDNMRDAFQFIGRNINDTFRKVGLEATGKKYASGTTIQDMKKDLIQRLLDNGQTAFKDKLGRKWRLDTYAEMVARTTTREAASVATINECKEFGIDLVQISTHYPTCEICAPLQGKVFSISGKDKRYPKLTDEYRPPFHPNCRHVLMPYVREFDDNAEEKQRYSNTSLTKDPRSEAEKQAYKDMRDAVTIATNRKRAREVLLNDQNSLEDKRKAARKLLNTYEKVGKKPIGIDNSLIKTWLIDVYGGTPGKPIPLGDFEKIRADIKAGKYKLEINKQKQNRHIPGTKEYEKHYSDLIKKGYKHSILTVDAQEIVNKYYGTGEVISPAFGAPPKEIIQADYEIGEFYDIIEKKYIKTNRAVIAYSKTGTHVYPTRPIKKDGGKS